MQVIRGGFIHLEDSEVGTVQECNAVFCVGFRPQRETEEMREMELQVIFMGDGLSYKEIAEGLGRAVMEELDELSKGNRELALKMTDGFLRTFLEGAGKIAEQHKEADHESVSL